jgi:ATP-binding cassette subfamily F protein 3
MGKRLKAISDQLEADEARWLELGEQIEALS